MAAFWHRYSNFLGSHGFALVQIEFTRMVIVTNVLVTTLCNSGIMLQCGNHHKNLII